MMRRRVKLLIQILVCILVIDGIFVLYKYRKIYHSDQPMGGEGLPHKPVFKSRRHFFQWYREQDRKMSLQQVSSILDHRDLQIAQSRTRSNKDAVRSVLLLKTHKTGSSTIQNILLRYAILHNLTIALPAYKASFFWPLPFDAAEFVTEQEGIARYDMLVHHSKFQETEMKKVMKEDAKFITILREPVSLFRSAFTYYNMNLSTCFNTSIDDIMSSPNIELIQDSGRCRNGLPVKNLQAFDLGLTMDSMDRASIEALIKQMDRVMTFVIITERFDESLVLLRKMFNWDMEDIVYFKQNAQAGHVGGRSRHSPELDKSIASLNMADTLIYNHFVNKLQEQLDKAFTKDELETDLNTLHKLQNEYYNRCVEQTAPATSRYFRNVASGGIYFRPYGANTMGYILKNSSLRDINCRLLVMPELSLTHFLKGVAAAAQSTESH